MTDEFIHWWRNSWLDQHTSGSRCPFEVNSQRDREFTIWYKPLVIVKKMVWEGKTSQKQARNEESWSKHQVEHNQGRNPVLAMSMGCRFQQVTDYKGFVTSNKIDNLMYDYVSLSMLASQILFRHQQQSVNKNGCNFYTVCPIFSTKPLN